MNLSFPCQIQSFAQQDLLKNCETRMGLLWPRFEHSRSISSLILEVNFTENPQCIRDGSCLITQNFGCSDSHDYTTIANNCLRPSLYLCTRVFLNMNVSVYPFMPTSVCVYTSVHVSVFAFIFVYSCKSVLVYARVCLAVCFKNCLRVRKVACLCICLGSCDETACISDLLWTSEGKKGARVTYAWIGQVFSGLANVLPQLKSDISSLHGKAPYLTLGLSSRERIIGVNIEFAVNGSLCMYFINTRFNGRLLFKVWPVKWIRKIKANEHNELNKNVA